jgi:hypothetical protein
MAVDNPRVRARSELEELGLSRESASYLVDDRPPGGWESLVTHDQLRVELALIRTEMAEIRTEIATLAGGLRAEMERGFRAQTWRLTTAMFVAFGVFAALARL